MNSPEDQSDSRLASSYVDPEEFDMSEQQFSASLERSVQRPHFELDMVEEPARKATVAVTRPSGHDGRATATSGQSWASAGQEPDAPVFMNGSDKSGVSGNENGVDANWREQVSAKVSRYKSRRPRQERYPSLQLQFEPSTREPNDRREQKNRAKSSVHPEFVSDAMYTEMSAGTSGPPPVLAEATARVLEFPRYSAPPLRRDELAEPVMDRPRIVEAPELFPPPPAMGGILIGPRTEPEPERRHGLDVPLLSSQLNRRMCAGLIDLLVVASAVALFLYAFFQISRSGPSTRILDELIAGLLAILWPSYQYALLVFSGTTPGLRLTKLQLQRFDGSPVPQSLRRWRVLASVLSAASLGLGYAWCFLDEDQLAWHDRITRTHLAQSRPNPKA